MTAVWARTRAELRGRWRAWLGLALLLGLAGGVVMALAAGARRADTAYDRLLAAERPGDLEIGVGALADAGVAGPLAVIDRLGRLPGVAEHGLFAQFTADPGDNSSFTTDVWFDTVAAADDGAQRLADRWKLLQGRRADPSRTDEAVVSFTTAEQYRLRAGSRLRLRLFTRQEAAALYQDGSLTRLPAPSAGRWIELRVVGVVAPAEQFPPRIGVSVGSVLLTPAFARTFTDRYAIDGLLRVRLAGGDGRQRFADGVRRLTGVPLAGLVNSEGDQRALTRRALHLPAVALWLLTALTATAVLLVAGQALARQAFLEAGDNQALWALGMTGGQLWTIAMLRAAIAGLGGAVVAVAVAVALSGLFPLGLGRVAEPHPGSAADGVPLAAGAAAVVVVAVALSAWPAWRARRPGDVAARATGHSVVAEILAGGGVPAPGVVGVRLALEPGRGSTAVPVRATVLGAIVAVAALAAALTLGASLDHFLRTPRLYGWNWDVTVGDGGGPDLSARIDRLLAADPAVSNLSAGTIGILQLGAGGPTAIAWATESVRGSITPTVIDGRAPAGPDEILLGARTLQAAGARVGDQVQVRLQALSWQPLDAPVPSRRLRIVGSGVLPLEGGAIGEGAALTWDGLARLVPVSARPAHNLLLLRWAPGADPAPSWARLLAVAPHLGLPQRPADVANFGRIQQLPALAAGVVAAVAVAMLAHLLVTSVRRRRRDLAVLKTLGFVRRQVSAAVAWQATTLLVLALVVGLPVGVAAGRWLWRLLATRLYVPVEPVVPLAAILLLIPAALLTANLVAAVPAVVAARTRPALVLRAE
jgi:FtsX-like permease family